MENAAMIADSPVATPKRAAVTASGLTKRYGQRVAVDHVDFELPAGVVSGFVGPNGAGKTTTIRMLLGLIRPSEGPVLGQAISDPPNYLPPVGALIEAQRSIRRCPAGATLRC